MPLLVLARIVTGLLSLAVLGAGGYFLWSWWQGEVDLTTAGEVIRHRDDWRLWLGLGLLAFSLLGRLVVVPLLASPEKGERFRPQRQARFETITAPTGPLAVFADGPDTTDVVVLTHGWGVDAQVWERTRRALARRWRVISWDLPGLGQSKGRLEATNLEQFANDLALVMARVRSGRLILVGHSIGGMTIQALLRDRPELFADRVVGVALVNTTHTNPLETMWLSSLAKALRWPVLEPALWVTSVCGPIAQLMAWQSYLSGASHLANRVSFGPDVTRSELDRISLIVTRNRQDIQARGDLAMFRWDSGRAVKALKTPLLVLAGDVDLVTKRQASETIAAAAPHAALQVIPRANHMGFVEQAEAYTAALEAFAERCFGAGSIQPDASNSVEPKGVHEP